MVPLLLSAPPPLEVARPAYPPPLAAEVDPLCILRRVGVTVPAGDSFVKAVPSEKKMLGFDAEDVAAFGENVLAPCAFTSGEQPRHSPGSGSSPPPRPVPLAVAVVGTASVDEPFPYPALPRLFNVAPEIEALRFSVVDSFRHAGLDEVLGSWRCCRVRAPGVRT